MTIATVIITHEHNRETLLDGANLMQCEIAAALAARGKGTAVAVRLEDLFRQSDRPEFHVTKYVYCAADPFAYIAFLIRERTGLDFRIVRSVQTCAWAGYLLQEHLCLPLERPDDITIYPSQYCRNSYSRWFGPHWSGRHMVRRLNWPGATTQGGCAPRAIRFRAGYVGRISRDKNFSDCLAAFAQMKSADPDARFQIVGAPYETHYGSHDVEALIDGYGLGGCCVLTGALSHAETILKMREIETLVFPSTSTVESFGRVVGEALAAGVHCAVADHGAMREMFGGLPLAQVDRHLGKKVSCYENSPSGSVAPQALATGIIRSTRPVVDRFRSLLTNPADFCDEILHGRLAPAAGGVPHAAPVLGSLSGVEALSACDARHAIRFLIEQGRRFLSDSGRSAVMQMLAGQTAHPARTERFIARTKSGHACLAELGGWALECGHLLEFRPQLTIGP